MDKNIIVLMLDTVRAEDVHHNSNLSTIGYIARNGTNYTNAVAPGTWTAPTHASLFTNSKVTRIKEASQDFFRNGTIKIDPWMVRTKFLNEGAETIASKLSEYNYYSVLFSNNPFLTSYTNLAIGFDKVYDVWMYSNAKYNEKLVEKMSFIINGGSKVRKRMYKVSYAMSKLMPVPVLDSVYLKLRAKLNKKVAEADGTYRLDRGAIDTNKELSNYLKYNYNYKQQFIFINYIEAHENYPISKDKVQDKWLYLSGVEEMDENTTRSLHNGYLRRISYLDKRVGEVINILNKNGMLDNATLIITSDHGQAFGEHKMLYHAMPPYEEVAKVPLIAINYENGKAIKVRDQVDKPVSLLSLHDAIIRLASGKEDYLNGNIRGSRYTTCEHTGISEGWDEELLLLLKKRANNARKIYAAKKKYNRKATAVYKGNMKLIHFFGAKPDELYNIENDPKETTNIIGQNRSIAIDMLQYLHGE
jgi:arylsulfatase A-like enzyme